MSPQLAPAPAHGHQANFKCMKIASFDNTQTTGCISLLSAAIPGQCHEPQTPYPCPGAVIPWTCGAVGIISEPDMELLCCHTTKICFYLTALLSFCLSLDFPPKPSSFQQHQHSRPGNILNICLFWTSPRRVERTKHRCGITRGDSRKGTFTPKWLLPFSHPKGEPGNRGQGGLHEQCNSF